MTDKEKMRRAMAVENMHRIYKKYYPEWVEKRQHDADTGTYQEVEEKSTSFLFLLFPFFVP